MTRREHQRNSTPGGLCRTACMAVISLMMHVAGAVGAATDSPDWTQVTRFNGTSSGPLDGLGCSVDARDNWIVIGEREDASTRARSGSVYGLDAKTRELMVKITLLDAGQTDDLFGSSVAVWGNRVLIGDPGTSRFKLFGGAAYLYRLLDGRQLAVYSPPYHRVYDKLGTDVDLNDKYAVISAPHPDGSDQPGYVAVYSAQTDRHLARLSPPNATVYDKFGTSLALHDHVLAVGAPERERLGLRTGAVYVYDLADQSIRYMLEPPDIASNNFGCDVAVNATVLVVGASAEKYGPHMSGSVYLFDLASGALLQRLTSPLTQRSMRFGAAVAADDHFAIIGTALFQGLDPSPDTPVIVLELPSGDIADVLYPPNSDDVWSHYGNAVAIDSDNDRIVVGASRATQNSRSNGAAYIYAPQFSLYTEGRCPGVIDVVAITTDSDDRVHFYRSDETDPGTGPVVGRCGDLRLDLTTPVLVGSAAPVDNEARLSRRFSDPLCRPQYLQAVQARSACRVSNVILVE